MNDNLGIGVMSSVNFKERYTACKTSWLKDFDNTFIFGGHDASLVDSNLISIQNAGENWESCFLKQQLGLKHMYDNNPNLDWYCIVGCDNILFKNKIVEELSKFNPSDELFLAQKCGYWTDSPYIHEIRRHDARENSINFWACAGGAGFFISNDLMKKCVTVIDEFNEFWKNTSGSNYGCADVGISYMLKKYFSVDITPVLYLLSQPPEHYLDESNHKWYADYEISVEQLVKTPMSLHYIKPSRMHEIYNLYKN